MRDPASRQSRRLLAIDVSRRRAGASHGPLGPLDGADDPGFQTDNNALPQGKFQARAMSNERASQRAFLDFHVLSRPIVCPMLPEQLLVRTQFSMDLVRCAGPLSWPWPVELEGSQ